MRSSEWWSRLFATIDTKNTAEFVAHLTPDAEFRYGSGTPVTGRSAIHDAVDNFLSTIESSAHRIERIVEQDACAVCEGWVRYVRRDGRVLELPFCNVLTFRDPLILRYHVYIDPSPLAAP